MASPIGSGIGNDARTQPRESQPPMLGSTGGAAIPGIESSNYETNEQEARTRKRDFFRLGKKAEDDKKKPKSPANAALQQPAIAANLRPSSPLAVSDSLRSPGSPGHPYGMPASPRNLRSASRTHSPASSMIFERNVQEDVVVPQASPSIPSHIMTENHIPPALDATSEAITDSKLDPDSVEIVTHATHQPAAVTITGGHNEQATGSLGPEDFPTHVTRQDTDNVSNYASLDSLDVRRLSFISFADVVHAEQELGERRDSQLTGHPGLVPQRSPSPLRSPVSSHMRSASPPTSVPTTERSPHRSMRGSGSPLLGQASPVGDLNIETMRQALRKTGSGDLSGFRSASLSAVGDDESGFRSFK